MWYNSISKYSDVVISSRARFARNIAEYKFPHILNSNEQKQIVDLVRKSIDSKEYKFFEMKDIDDNNKCSLVEKHLISKEFLNNEEGAIVVNDDYSLVTMINEEDHLRIQSFEPGFNIDNAYNRLRDFTDELNRKINFAISDKYGYLTSCPTNVGSAMRISVMLHLPGLAKLGLLNKVLDQASSIGFAIRGIYGENTEGIGNIYQISNQKTLGLSDNDIIYNTKAVITTIVEQERKARDILLSESLEYKDSIYRAYGILKYSRMISTEEAIKLLSKVRLGVAAKILDEASLEKIQSLMVDIEPCTLRCNLKEDFSEDEERSKRADYIRKELN